MSNSQTLNFVKQEKSNNNQFKGDEYTNYSGTDDDIVDTIKGRDTAFSKVTVTDTRDLIDIVSKLQNNYQVSSILPLFYELEALLKIKGISVGVYDSEAQKNTYIVGTGTKDITTELMSHIKTHVESHSFYSIHERTMVFYGYYDKRLCAYLYFQRESNYLTDSQKQLLKFLQPYIYACACRLFHISNEFTELNLTSREQEVMEWIKEGKDNWTIGKILGVSERTIKFHVCNLFKKIGVNSRTEAICWYFRFMTSLNTLFNQDKHRDLGY